MRPLSKLPQLLKSLLSAPRTNSAGRRSNQKVNRRLLLESLECRKVFDAGWASTMDNVLSAKMAGDAAGNQFITGHANGYVKTTFQNLAFSPVGNNNLFVAKQSSSGVFEWVTFAGNPTGGTSRAIATDTMGHVYVAGWFIGTAQFGNQTLTSTGNSDGFIAQLDATTGQFIWARQIGGAGRDQARSIDVDQNGNLVVVGGFDMTETASNDAPTLFATKLDSNGTQIWSQTFSGAMSGSFASASIDTSGSIYLGGRFQGTLDLPTGPLTSTASIPAPISVPISDGLLAKLDANGNLLWARAIQGDSAKGIIKVDANANGSVVIAGSFYGTSYFDGTVLSSAGDRDGFVANLDSNSGAVVWAKRVGGLGPDGISDFQQNTQGDIFAVGTFDSSASFGSQTVVADGRVNAFLTKVSSAGQFLTTNRFITGTTNPEMTASNTPNIFGLHMDSAGSLYVLGSSYYGGSTSWLGFYTPQKPIAPRLSNVTYNFDFVVKLPPVEPTKFYVVDDSIRDRTYQYASNGELTVDSFSITPGNMSPRGAASNAAGTTVWVGDWNRNVYVYSNSGVLQGKWAASSLSSTAQVEGVATNGTDVWIVDNKTNKVFRHAGAASRISGSQAAASSFALNSSNSNPKGIVTDGTYIWVVNDSTTDKIFKYTVSGSFLGSWTIDSANRSPTGLTIDPTNGSQSIWVVDNGTDKIYQYTDARNRTSGSQAASARFVLAEGNTNPQGIADPPPPSMLESTTNATTTTPSNQYEAAPMAEPKVGGSDQEALLTHQYMDKFRSTDEWMCSLGANMNAATQSPFASNDLRQVLEKNQAIADSDRDWKIRLWLELESELESEEFSM